MRMVMMRTMVVVLVMRGCRKTGIGKKHYCHRYTDELTHDPIPYLR
jgi:hypothetical protein